jgi:hypothetical protein
VNGLTSLPRRGRISKPQHRKGRRRRTHHGLRAHPQPLAGLGLEPGLVEGAQGGHHLNEVFGGVLLFDRGVECWRNGEEGKGREGKGRGGKGQSEVMEEKGESGGAKMGNGTHGEKSREHRSRGSDELV